MLCCLFSNAFLNSSFSQLHNTRAWWIGQMCPSWTPCLHSGWPRHHKDACMSDLLAAYKVSRVCRNYRCPVLKHPGGQYLEELHTQEQEHCCSNWAASDGTLVSPHFWQTLCLLSRLGSIGRMVSSPLSKNSNICQNWSPVMP